jgi:hypothetical protein
MSSEVPPPPPQLSRAATMYFPLMIEVPGKSKTQLEVSFQSSVDQLKHLIADKFGLVASQLQLSVDGRPLSPDETIDQQKINPNDTVKVEYV